MFAGSFPCCCAHPPPSTSSPPPPPPPGSTSTSTSTALVDCVCCNGTHGPAEWIVDTTNAKLPNAVFGFCTDDHGTAHNCNEINGQIFHVGTYEYPCLWCANFQLAAGCPYAIYLAVACQDGVFASIGVWIYYKFNCAAHCICGGPAVQYLTTTYLSDRWDCDTAIDIPWVTNSGLGFCGVAPADRATASVRVSHT